MESARVEAGLISPGREFEADETVGNILLRSPFDLGLDWAVKFTGRTFVGEPALKEKLAQGRCRFVLRSCIIDGPAAVGVPAPLYLHAGSAAKAVGSITSTAWSWGLSRLIGLVTVDAEFADLTEAWHGVDGSLHAVELREGPLLDFPASREVPARLVRP